jgi:hypothetical protein
MILDLLVSAQQEEQMYDRGKILIQSQKGKISTGGSTFQYKDPIIRVLGKLIKSTCTSKLWHSLSLQPLHQAMALQGSHFETPLG